MTHGKSSGANLRESTQPSTSRAKRKSLGARARAQQAASIQLARSGDTGAIRALLADLYAAGDITPVADTMIDFSPDSEEPQWLDSEVDWDDPDESVPDETHSLSAFQMEPVLAARSLIDEAELPQTREYLAQLIVSNRRCRVHRPDWWMRFTPVTDYGRQQLDEIGNRFDLLERLGEWLTDHRPDFLNSADPWDLGADALRELQDRSPSVSPEGFLHLSGLRKFVSPETFSRYRTDAALVWPDGSLPLDFIFGKEARLAWVAQAIRQFLAERHISLTDGEVEEYVKIKAPKRRIEKIALQQGNAVSMSLDQCIALSNQLGETQWTEVLARYRNQIFSPTP